MTPVQIPPLADFRKETELVYGNPWSVYLKEDGFSLTIPPWSILLDDEEDCAPHEESYQLALQVIADLDVVRDKAVEYLAGVVDAKRWGMHGGTYFSHIVCDAWKKEVTVALSWENNIYAEWTVTFTLRKPEGATTHEYRPYRMGYRNV
jgi:hypothetical protein